MLWLIVIYVVIGLVKATRRLSGPPDRKPLWMMTERNPLKWSLFFCVYVFAWPLAK